VTISSVQPSYSITSSDSDNTITISSGTSSGASSSYYIAGMGATGSSMDTITLTGGSSTYTISGGTGAGFIAQDITSINGSEFTWKMPEEFVDAFPDYDRIQDMCKQYPGLKIAYEKFVTTYKLIRDDYDTPEDQRPKP